MSVRKGEKVMFKKLIVPITIVCSFFLLTGIASSATITLEDPNSSGSLVTLSDGDGDDLNSVSGAVTYVGSIGDWYLNVTTGITKPALGSYSYPIMHLDSVDASSSSSVDEEILVTFTELNFGAVPGLIADLSATLAGSLEAEVWVNGTKEWSIVFGPGGSDSVTGAVINGPFPTDFDIMLSVLLTHPPGDNQASSFDFEVNAIPIPAAAWLFGSGLICLVGIRRKLRS
jgi:hypothetical protein